MSNLFNYIYEEKSILNSLCNRGYGNHIVIHKRYKEISKCIYYDNRVSYDILYVYSSENGCSNYKNIGSIKVSKIKYNGIIYHFCKRNNIDEICLKYLKTRGGQKCNFIIYPNHTVCSLVNKYEWNVLMTYFSDYDIIKIWFNLNNGWSCVDSNDTYI